MLLRFYSGGKGTPLTFKGKIPLFQLDFLIEIVFQINKS